MAEFISFVTNTTVIAVLLGYIFAIWIGLTIWTYVDISWRTDNYLYRILMVLLVALGLGFVGFAFYLMIRPPLTKGELSAQSLEEKLLLTSAAYAFCGNCGEAAANDFNFCVNCGMELRKTCPNCSYRLLSGWLACPNCGKNQGPEALPEILVRDEAKNRLKFPTFRFPNLSLSSVAESFSFAKRFTAKAVASQTRGKNETNRNSSRTINKKKSRTAAKAA